MKKKCLSIFISLAVTFSLCIPVTAETCDYNIDQYVIEGETYDVIQYYEGNVKVVITNVINGDGEKVTTKSTMDGENLTIYYDNGYVVSTSLEDLSTESKQESPLYVTYDTLETRYWDYYYYYSDMDFDEYGMYFSLKIGTDGSWFGYDKGDKDVRNLGYEFCEKVRDLDSAQALAYAATVTSTADIASSILDLLLKPTTSGAIKPTESDVISSVLNILGHFNAPANAAERWSKAYYAALDCNDVYSQFRDAL